MDGDFQLQTNGIDSQHHFLQDRRIQMLSDKMVTTICLQPELPHSMRCSVVVALKPGNMRASTTTAFIGQQPKLIAIMQRLQTLLVAEKRFSFKPKARRIEHSL